jgi:hypothetical protein
MKERFVKLFVPMFLGLALTLASGCAFTIDTSPDSYPFPSAEVFAVTPGVKVDVVNGHPDPIRTQLEGSTWCDLQDMTETAAAITRRELAKKGVVVGPGAGKQVVLDAGKQLVLRVLEPSWTRGFAVMGGVVTLEAKFGAETITVVGDARSGAGPVRVFDLSLTRAVEKLLKRPDLLAYLNAP